MIDGAEPANRTEREKPGVRSIDEHRLCVVHFIGRLEPGGVERRTLELIEATASKQLQHVICVTSGRRATLDRDYEVAGAEIAYLQIKSLLFPIRLVRLLRSLSADVTHSNIGNSSGYISFLSFISGVPNRIAHFQSDNLARRLGFYGSIQNGIMRSFINRFSTQIVGLTPKSLELAWSRHWRSDPRCVVVPNGVRKPIGTAARPSEYDDLATDTIIIHAGRADLITKNREKAISVFAAYLEINPQSRLVFVGRDGKNSEQADAQRRAWDDLAFRLGVVDRVHFLGEKDELYDYLLHSDGLLFTSTLEGLPGVVLEALNAGLQVTSTDLPGIEFISEHSRNVSLLSPSDSESNWASTLYKATPGKLTHDMRQTNMKDFESSIFNFDKALKRYLHLWRNGLSEDIVDDFGGPFDL